MNAVCERSESRVKREAIIRRFRSLTPRERQAVLAELGGATPATSPHSAGPGAINATGQTSPTGTTELPRLSVTGNTPDHVAEEDQSVLLPDGSMDTYSLFRVLLNSAILKCEGVEQLKMMDRALLAVGAAERMGGEIRKATAMPASTARETPGEAVPFDEDAFKAVNRAEYPEIFAVCDEIDQTLGEGDYRLFIGVTTYVVDPGGGNKGQNLLERIFAVKDYAAAKAMSLAAYKGAGEHGVDVGEALDTVGV